MFGVSGGTEVFALMRNYEPFLSSPESGEVRRSMNDDPVFLLTITEGQAVSYIEDMRQEDEGQVIICGRTSDNTPVYEFIWCNESAGWLVCTDDYREGRLILSGNYTKMAIDNALMVMYALATAQKGTALFHAAVVSCDGRGYMFLGKSGTGKSTHASLWLKHIEGAVLMNDDNPVVRISEGQAMVYGSPWSGKTPCYRNVSCPLGGIVLLSQAPYNKIQRLGALKAYMALVSSISGQRWDERIANGLHQTENELASNMPIWHLECLPDEAAATLCRATISF
ncbi:MAG: hypothetical protein IK075_00195 [Prevotella sp.]|nr:hypothetical protein [Prevotella sp.]